MRRRLDNKRSTTHPQANYKARVLNPFIKGLPKDDNNNDINKVSDELAVEDLFINMEHSEYNNNELSDIIAVEDFLVQQMMQDQQ
ncbi:unnamed protein product [Rhizophagus irregularis]|nr:unnamed protein product [Rhizophagus irregularis]CAB5099992.1 unnamed protein product [Rhizophagus irregularis]